MRLSLFLGILVFFIACTAIQPRIDEKNNSSDASNESDALYFDAYGSEVSTLPDSSNLDGDPVTCEEALSLKSYVGCDFWSVITSNPKIDLNFEPAIVVANAQMNETTVFVTGPNGFKITKTVAPNSLEKIYLPESSDETVRAKTPRRQFISLENEVSKLFKDAAYHVTSSLPVIVYQFNALQYQAVGGSPGKIWKGCERGPARDGINEFGLVNTKCYSVTNDASLLIPVAAMTGNYRINSINSNPFIAIVATENNTRVKVRASVTSLINAGDTIPAADAGGISEFTMQRGDVAQLTLLNKKNFIDIHLQLSRDFSGSIVQASAPVEVFSGSPCIFVPENLPACDHLEEIVLPAESLGKKYIVAAPTAPKFDIKGQRIRFVGNKDGTILNYFPSKPQGCPQKLDAGETSTCGNGDTTNGDITTESFVVEGTHEFSVSVFLPGTAFMYPEDQGVHKGEGDPSQSTLVSMEQFRKKYLFLTPNDYNTSFIDVTGPINAQIKVDGIIVTEKVATIASGVGIWRIKLNKTYEAHTLESSEPVGLQVLGYGMYTSYMVPGGLNLSVIAKAPGIEK